MQKPVAVSDSEVSPNYFALGIRELEGAKRQVVFELSDRSKIDWGRVDRLMRSYLFIGYNWLGFDKPLIRWCVENPEATTEQIKDVANRIIAERIPWWEAEDKLGIAFPKSWESVDLMGVQPNPVASLKTLAGRMHAKRMKELPYAHDAILTPEQRDETNVYMGNDLDVTETLWHTLAEPIALRETLGATIGVDLRSKSDGQMGMALIKKRVESEIGRRLPRPNVSRLQRFKYEAPAYLSFETAILRDMMERLRTYEFQTDPITGKAGLPDFLLRPVELGRSTYAMGIGGLHSTEANRAVHADMDNALLSFDVASYYPAIILSLGLVPAAIGDVFLKVYDGLRHDRLAAKKRKDKTADKGLKIALNSTFGNLGSPYSIVYAPHLLIATTITGQLALLMLIERAESLGISVISANTDGVEMLVPREMYAGLEGDRPRPSDLADLIAGWERDTGFNLEGVEYKALYNQSVNNYFAIKTGGGHKRRGDIGNPWSKHPDDFDVRGQLMKNPQMTICSDAALARIKDGVPLEDTIRGCKDIRQFVTVIKVTKGGTWRGDYLGKVVRYYWGAAGEPIYESEANPKTGSFKTIAKTEGAVPCMTLPDEMPHDIDYNRYVQEAEKILKDVGFYGSIPAPRKTGRLTEEKLRRLMPWLLM